ncbi:MAG TPA: response regulator [Gallionella sp.]|nr:response regulator [Gallionella sp.]
MTPTILIVDDSADEQSLYQRALKYFNCRLVASATGKDGYASAIRLQPDLILLDYHLPDMDGLGFMELLSKHPGSPIPVIVLTGEGNVEVAVDVMKRGADDYIIKDTAGLYLKLLPTVIERVLAVCAQREQSRRLRHETETLLRRNQALMKNSMDGIHVMDVDGNLIEANDAFYRMLGYAPEEGAGLNVADWDAQWPAEELRAKFKAMIGKSAVFETRHRRKDGTLINVEVSAACVELDGQHLFFAASRDISGRKQVEQTLLECDQRKDEFLAMLAHELRNPLVPIRNAAHVIGRLGLDEPRIKWAQQVIESQVGLLSHMVDDLLDVSRIARGKITLKQEEVEFAALIERLMHSILPLAENKGHLLAVSLPEQPIRLQGDPARLTQVLFNLLDNAIKYTPDGGRIEFTVRLAGHEVEIGVRDNGMGITAALLPRVFDLFQQDERTLERAHGGLGIGLTLVQRLVWMHGGRVSAYSDGPGRGSTFSVWLPVRDMPERAIEPEEAGMGGVASGARVLVVDDDYAVADSTAMLLELEGYTVHVVDNGLAALAQIAVFRPQVVLLDIGLKGMDGFETARRLRELPEGRGLCVVAITGYADEKTRAQALASGCNHFLVKPVTFAVLGGLLGSVVAAAQPD